MKKTFNIISVVCMLATIAIVVYIFFRNIEPGYKVYSYTYNYTQNLNSKSLITDIEDCSELSKTVLNGTTLTEEQKSYLDVLSVSISKLDSFEQTLSLNLLSENKKTAKTSKLIKSINSLSETRNNLLFELDVYTVKMSGNTIGDPVGTYSTLIKDVLSFINEYNNSFVALKNYVIEECDYNQTILNIFDIYSNSLQNSCDSYDGENIIFNNGALKTLISLNSLITLKNNNLETSIVGGIYSTTASNFNNYYSRVNKTEFVKTFYLKSYNDININTEQRLDSITYYYLITLLGVN